MRRHVASLVLALGLAVSADAQVGGSLVGVVRDQTDRPVAGAQVVAETPERGIVRQVTSDEQGRYRVVGLPPFVYVVTVSAPGFAATRHTGVVVAVDTVRRLDVLVEVAGPAATVDVEAPQSILQTDTADLGLVVDRQTIATLPLNRRDVFRLGLLVAGTAPSVEGSELSSRGAFAFHASGGREEANTFLLDGIDNNDAYVNRYVVQPSAEAVETFKVVTSSYSAEHGQNAGAQMLVVTRSGSSRYEGYAYEHVRDDVLDARNAFDAGAPSPFRRHQAGAGVGGPVVAGRVFFFGAVDVRRERQGIVRLARVPSLAERTGDFSATGQALVDPFAGEPIPGNVIPVDRISPTARRVIDTFPLPNASGVLNYRGTPTRQDDEWLGHLRVDIEAGAKGRLMARMSLGRVSMFEPFAEDAGAVSGFGEEVDDRPLQATLQWQRVFGTHGVGWLRLGVNRLGRDIRSENHDVDVGAAWGVDWLDVPSRARGFPVLNVAGVAPIGDTTSLPILRTTTTWHVAPSFVVERGAHLVKVGGDMRHARLDGTLDLLARGSISFSGAYTGSGVADLLLGLPSFAIKATTSSRMQLGSTMGAVYVQDDWRMTPAVSVNLGVRYELATPPRRPGEGLAWFDAESGRLVETGRAPLRATVRADRNNVAPRAGIAWTLAPGVVVRAGAGLYFDTGSFLAHSAQFFNPPHFALRVYVPLPGRPLSLDDPFPSGGGLAPPAALNLVNPDLVLSSTTHWNIAVERAMAGALTARVAYVGARGRHLVQARDLNQPAPAPGLVQARRPYPTYGSIFFIDSRGRSSYHALQVGVDRRLRAGWMLVAHYTLARSMDENSTLLDTRPDTNLPQNSHDIAAEWGPSSFDVRHRATVALGVALPERWVVTRRTDLRVLASAQSGMPFTPVLRFDNSNTGNTGGTAGSDRPNLVGDPTPSPQTAARWIDPAAFVVAPRYAFGDAGRNIVRGPGWASVDVSMARRFGPVRDIDLVVELQAFNLFNRVNLHLPEKWVDEPATFGRILSAGAPRQLQLAVRAEF